MDETGRAAPRVAVVAGRDGGGRLRPLGADGTPAGPVVTTPDLARDVADTEARSAPRWVWADTDDTYGALVSAGVRVGRSHDAALTEALLVGMDGRAGEPRGLDAALARVEGRPVPRDARRGPARDADQGVLFAAGGEGAATTVAPADPLDALVTVHAAQLRRVEDRPDPGRARLLVVAESAAALAAAEMTVDGLPWRTERHDELLTDLLGSRPAGPARPERVEALAGRVGELLGRPGLNPDSPAQVVAAFAAVGVAVPSTRASVLEQVDHPAAAVLLEYKELARLHSAYGWSWGETWAQAGRLRAEYVVGGVVSGRWATRGGGGLQLPRILRGAVVADPGWVLVAADAGQLEPRLLAAISGDPALGAIASRPGDLYAAVASVAFDGDRAAAKLALLGAMYGATTGAAGAQLAGLQRRFGAAMGLLERSARAGERGEVVTSTLGRTCPPPPPDWPGWDDGPGRTAASRARGRFTRNFVIQASASDWASVWIAGLRRRLRAAAHGPVGRDAHLALFQHDEVLVHCPAGDAAAVGEAVAAAGAEATARLFAGSPVTIPLEVATVASYADAKG